MGEVAERSEAGEGISECSTLSVTFGDSSPRGGAKGVYLMLAREMERIVPIRSINCFAATYQSRRAVVFRI